MHAEKRGERNYYGNNCHRENRESSAVTLRNLYNNYKLYCCCILV
jgi:hypothetical protein